MAFLAKLSSGRANFSCNVPLENALRRLRAGLGNLPFQSTLSTCLGHPSRGLSFLPCKRFVAVQNYHPRESFRRNDLSDNVNV